MLEQNNQNYYQYFTYTLADTAILTIQTHANFLILLSNTSTTDVDVAIGGQSFQKLPAGLSIQLPTSDVATQLQFQNNTGGSITIKFALSNGRIVNSSLILSASSVLSINTSATSIVTPAAISAVTAAGGTTYTPDPTCRELHVYNVSTTRTVYYGDANVDGSADRGIPIAPQEKVIIAVSGAIRFRAVGGAATLGIAELRGA